MNRACRSLVCVPLLFAIVIMQAAAASTSEAIVLSQRPRHESPARHSEDTGYVGCAIYSSEVDSLSSLVRFACWSVTLDRAHLRGLLSWCGRLLLSLATCVRLYSSIITAASLEHVYVCIRLLLPRRV